MTGPWRMPAESEPHERAWMAWPSAPYTLGTTAAEAEVAWTAWAAVANAVAEHEALTMLVTPEGYDEARRRLTGSIVLHRCALDDAWYRDTGPTFVLGSEGLGAVNWRFNGWGQQDWARWEHDSTASEIATELSGAERIASTLVNEGGGLHTDGAGTFLVTETVQLDPHRNPGWSKADVEAELSRTLGATTVIWLPRGLTRDQGLFGTRGHVDIVAAFIGGGRVLVHDQRDAAHPDAQVTAQVVEILTGSRDSAGRTLEVVRLPAPKTLSDGDDWVDYSYVNHFVVNGAVIACGFDDPVDEEAAEVLAEVYPSRVVRAVDARALFARGGGVHCITQHQPAVQPAAETPGRAV